MADVMKVLEDLKYKAVGVDPKTKEKREGFFVSFRPIGLPIPKSDFKNPWTPTGSNMKEILDSKANKNNSAASEESQDPADVEAVSVSKMLDDQQFMTANIGASQQAFLQTFMITDEQIVLNETYQSAPGNKKVSDIWWAIINGANGIAPDLELNEDMKKTVEKAKAVLMTDEGDPTKKYDKYLEYREEYQDAVRGRDRQYASAMSNPMALQMWPIQGKTYQDDVKFAWEQWQGFGFKQEIEEATAVLSSQGIDPAILLISRAKHKYENSLVNIANVGNIPYTFMTPSKWYSANSPGWNSYTQTDFHTETHFNSKKSKTKASGGINVGFFHAGGHGSTSKDNKKLNISTDKLTITFDYAIADIKRPWLDTSLLGLDNWFLKGDYPKSCISNGTFEQQFDVNSPTQMSFLPSVVTSIILTRNVEIKWAATESDIQTINSAAEGGGSVGFGPWGRAKASHSESSSERDTSYDMNSQGFKIDGVQLIGYVSAITPGSPKKNGKDFMQKKKDQPAPVKPTPASDPAPSEPNL